MHVYTTEINGATSLSAATAKTVLQLRTPATRAGKLKEVRVSCNSTTATDGGVLVEIVRQTSAGTAGSTPTPRPNDVNLPAALSTVGASMSAEPTDGGVVLFQQFIPAQQGLLIYTFPKGEEPTVGVSGYLGLRLTATNAQTTVRAAIVHEE